VSPALRVHVLLLQEWLILRTLWTPTPMLISAAKSVGLDNSSECANSLEFVDEGTTADCSVALLSHDVDASMSPSRWTTHRHAMSAIETGELRLQRQEWARARSTALSRACGGSSVG